MSSAKKIQPISSDKTSAQIQEKFDSVFESEKKPMENNNGTGGSADDEKNAKNTGPKLDLDLTAVEIKEVTPKENAAATLAPAIPAGDGPDFTLNFDLDDSGLEGPLAIQEASTASEVALDVSGTDGFSLDDIDMGEIQVDDRTKKTLATNISSLTGANLDDFTIGKSSEGANMNSPEDKANIESTIKDILNPDLSQDIDIPFEETTAVTNADNSASAISEVEDSILNFSENTPSKGFDLSSVDLGSDETDSGLDSSFSLNDELTKIQSAMVLDQLKNYKPAPTEFNVDEIEEDTFMTAEEAEDIDEKTIIRSIPVITKVETRAANPVVTPVPEPVHFETSSYETASNYGGSAPLNTEDSMRFQATIRALREEREELLNQVKKFKGETKEFEQDNLTLKASLDEAKIEITILRKRHMVELEDLKYRLTMSEEKKALAEERARQAELQRSKLEQKVRIDFNQVKQREKELESKLELLAMDVDSQVQGRDQKILELRRKIDALEFNMENASIKEHKSHDDKRKLEDRLNKIMKTLRQSIKNLEDDIDHVEEEDDRQKEKN